MKIVVVSPDEEHGDVPLGLLVDLLEGLLVQFHGGDHLLNVAKDHVQVLMVAGMINNTTIIASVSN